ncbi:unnamed protein product [Darwinula stevensoni]|uniref:Transposase n=1 Tax=Darwinula stevensoni TaxID=69355 RepID=A0A7R9FQE6_9CRUS|nr:unnamed protein product [Darwinula stevensoni]CAG0899630.1 unnamed protein product [Darwinula stevensoni]
MSAEMVAKCSRTPCFSGCQDHQELPFQADEYGICGRYSQKWSSLDIQVGGKCASGAGYVHPKSQKVNTPGRSSEENVQVVQDMFIRSPKKSTRQAARESGLTRHTIQTVLEKELNFRPWKPHSCQALSAEDCDRRMEYGEIMLAWYADWPQLFNNIGWSDEAVFHVGRFVNRHNCHYWAREDPGATV